MSPQTLQIRLAKDEGLENIWNYLMQRYEGLDKASIIRLALNTLAREAKKADTREIPTFAEIRNHYEQDTPSFVAENEDEFYTWWNSIKS